MDPNREFLEYLDIQPEAEFLSKGDLLERVRALGGHISPRNLAFYTAEGLVPRSIRVGSRVGAYPRSVASLLAWISRARERGLPIDAIRELTPLWRFLYRAVHKDGELDLSELEYVARQHATSSEAAWAVPSVVNEVLHCPNCISKMRLILKNQQVEAADEPMTISFEMTTIEPGAASARPVAVTTITLPVVRDTDGEDPRTIVLGTPVGVPVDRSPIPDDEEVELTAKPTSQEIRTGDQTPDPAARTTKRKTAAR